MYILVEPQFFLAENTEHKNINTIENGDEVQPKIIEKLKNMFPGEDRISRLENSSLFKIETLYEDNTFILEHYELPPTYFEKLAQQPVVPINITIDGASQPAKLKFEYFPISDDDEMKNASDKKVGYLNVEPRLSEIRAVAPKLNALQEGLNDIIISNTAYLFATFAQTNINNSYFKGALLWFCDFTVCVFNNCNFYEADLRYMNTSVVTTVDKKTTFKKCNFGDGSNLRYADLTQTTFDQCFFFGADLCYAKFSKDTKFKDCQFNDITFLKHAFDSVELRGILAGMSNEFEGIIFKNESGIAMEEEEEEDDYDAVTLAHRTQIANELAEEADNELQEEPKRKIPDLLLDPNAAINDNVSGYTYYDIVRLLSSDKKLIILPVSKMETEKWYRMAERGDTSFEEWKKTGFTDKNKSFKCLFVPAIKTCEGFVYESQPECMAVHELAEKLDLNEIFMTFYKIVGEENITTAYEDKQYFELDKEERFKAITIDFYKLLISLLGKHNADNDADAWSHVFDDLARRKHLVKHAMFHGEEGLLYHPYFDQSENNVDGVYPASFVLLMFIKSLPLQVQIEWAQNYMKEFITGYGQSLEDFKPLERTPDGFFASCINGNFEKLLLNIITGIVKFLDSRKIIETPEEIEQKEQFVMREKVEKALFQDYYLNNEDDAGPTLEGYVDYIRDNNELPAEKKKQYIALLERDPTIISKLQCTISMSMGGGKKKGIMKKKGKCFTKKGIVKKNGKCITKKNKANGIMTKKVKKTKKGKKTMKGKKGKKKTTRIAKKKTLRKL